MCTASRGGAGQRDVPIGCWARLHKLLTRPLQNAHPLLLHAQPATNPPRSRPCCSTWIQFLPSLRA